MNGENMEKCFSITIRKVSNGYHVCRADGDRSRFILPSDEWVFPDLKTLGRGLKDHFEPKTIPQIKLRKYEIKVEKV